MHPILTLPDLEDAPEEKVLRALKCIADKFGPGKPQFTTAVGADFNSYSWLLALIAGAGPVYTPHHAVLLFVYTLVPFEGVFVEEMVASAIQLSMDRQSPVVNQYFAISIPLEKLRSKYLNLMVQGQAVFDSPQFLNTGMADAFLDDAILLVGACFVCQQHLASDFASSEYVNRRNLDAIVTRILRTAASIDITFSEQSHLDVQTSRFGRKLDEFRTIRKQFVKDEKEFQKQVEFDRREQQKKADFVREEARRDRDLLRKMVGQKFTYNLHLQNEALEKIDLNPR